MELIFGDGSLPLRIPRLLDKKTQDGLSRKHVVEIGRLVVHPDAQGSDIVLGMVQKVHSILIGKGGYDILILAMKKLAPMYARIGFKPIGGTVSHPILNESFLQPMILEKDVYLEAKRINSYAWKVAFEATHKMMMDYGLVSNIPFNLWQKLQVKLGPTLVKLSKSQKKNKSKKEKKEIRDKKIEEREVRIPGLKTGTES